MQLDLIKNSRINVTRECIVINHSQVQCQRESVLNYNQILLQHSIELHSFFNLLYFPDALLQCDRCD